MTRAAAHDKWEFWIDRGGTFTDVVARRPDGEVVTHKLLSENPRQYNDAAIRGIAEILRGAGHDIDCDKPLPGEKIGAVKMGTTVATNALLERRGAHVAGHHARFWRRASHRLPKPPGFIRAGCATSANVVRGCFGN